MESRKRKAEPEADEESEKKRKVDEPPPYEAESVIPDADYEVTAMAKTLLAAPPDDVSFSGNGIITLIKTDGSRITAGIFTSINTKTLQDSYDAIDSGYVKQFIFEGCVTKEELKQADIGRPMSAKQRLRATCLLVKEKSGIRGFKGFEWNDLFFEYRTGKRYLLPFDKEARYRRMD